MTIDTEEKNEGKTPLKAELGYSRDAHPELLQVMLQMITDSNGIPVYMKPQDGNTSDNIGFQTSFSIVRRLKDAIDFKYLVADAALFTQDNIKELENQTLGGKKLLYITRAPNKINAVKELILKVKQENNLEEITEDYSGKLMDFEYAGVKFKALYKVILIYVQILLNNYVQMLSYMSDTIGVHNDNTIECNYRFTRKIC